MFTTLLTAAALTWTAPVERDRPDRGPGYIGIYYAEQDNGFLISEVNAGSPAEKAGLLPGDIMRKVNGQAPTNKEDFGRTVTRLRAGSIVELEVVRNGGDPKVVKLRLGVRPPNLPTPVIYRDVEP